MVIVTDEPKKYGADIPAGVKIHHRDDLDSVQRELRDIEGLTILIYDQTCAAEKRRRRKRGKFPDPDRRIFINQAVCENCGDCTIKSNCISVQPSKPISAASARSTSRPATRTFLASKASARAS